MKHFFVVTNRSKNEALATAQQVLSFLENHGCCCDMQNFVRYMKDDQDGHLKEADIPEQTECIIVLGGDGTLIQTARDMAKKDIALIGVNLGRLGYLAEIEKEHIEQTLERLIADEYEIEERMMLCGLANVGGKGLEKEFALNDIVITRRGSLRLITFHVYVNGKLLKTYGADGIIVSTPTGSTGYNLSAGGPIVEPSARVLLLTPINAHTLNSRSIVLSPEDDVRIEIGAGRHGNVEAAEAVFDGVVIAEMTSGDYLKIGRAKETTKIIKMSKENFLDVLRRKFQDAE